MCEVAPHSTPTYPSLSVIFSRAFIHSNQQSIRVRPAHSGVAPAAHISAGMTRLSHFWPHKHHFWRHSRHHTCLPHNALATCRIPAQMCPHWFSFLFWRRQGETKILLLAFPGLLQDSMSSFFWKGDKYAVSFALVLVNDYYDMTHEHYHQPLR